MPCMCGDLQCGSCGPAQGNWRCPLCHAWADAGCEHLTQGGKNVKRKYRAEVERLARAEAEAEHQLFVDLNATNEWARKLAGYPPLSYSTCGGTGRVFLTGPTEREGGIGQACSSCGGRGDA